MTLNIRAKIVIISIAILLISNLTITIVHSIVFSNEYSDLLESETDIIGQTLNSQLKKLLELNIPVNELVGFEKQCLELVVNNNIISYAMVISPEGKILFHNNPQQHGQIISKPTLLNSIKTKKKHLLTTFMNNEQFHDLLLPVIGKHGEHHAAIRIGFSSSIISEKLMVMVKYTILITFASIIMGICLLVYPLNLLVVKPLRNLIKDIKDISLKGSLDVQVIKINSKDEVGQLAGSFNQMITDLQKTTVSTSYVSMIISTMMDALIVINRDGVIKTVNEATAKLLHYSEHELLGQNVKKIFGHRNTKLEQDLNHLTRHDSFSGEERTFMTKQGTIISVLFSAAVMWSQERKFEGIVLLASDISKRKLVEEELRENKDKYYELFEGESDAVMVFDAETEIFEEANQATLNLFQYDKEEFFNLKVTDISAEKEQTEISVNRVITEKTDGKRVTLRYLQRKDGSIFPAEISAGHFTAKARKKIIGAVRDISKRIEAEEDAQKMQLKMITSSKLASLGEIAAGVAHEINQPLTYISTFLQKLEMDLENQTTITHQLLLEKLDYASNQIDRITSIIDHLRYFGRKYETQMTPISIKTVLDNSLLLLRERLRLRNIELSIDIVHDLPEIKGNSHQLEQIFINLFQNSIDAFGDNLYHNAQINIKMMIEKTYVRTVFSDNGPGMSQEILNKIYEPFFTTKEEGQGTGLGLSIVYGVIKDHKGSIYCNSQINKGSHFSILLPIENTKSRVLQ